jgi:hypothetical protein
MFRDAAAATDDLPEAWVVGRSGSPARNHAARFADIAASRFRRPMLRDSARDSRGALGLTWWVDRPGGIDERAEINRSLASAESVIALGPRTRPSITRPFTPSEIAVDRDTLSFYMSKLADTSFYSIGGCSEIEIVLWNASERLGYMGPGVLPALVERMRDPNPFVRERVQDALLLASQDEQVLARTQGEYLKFYDQPPDSARTIVAKWWARFGHFWTAAKRSH